MVYLDENGFLQRGPIMWLDLYLLVVPTCRLAGFLYLRTSHFCFLIPYIKVIKWTNTNALNDIVLLKLELKLLLTDKNAGSGEASVLINLEMTKKCF